MRVTSDFRYLLTPEIGGVTPEESCRSNDGEWWGIWRHQRRRHGQRKERKTRRPSRTLLERFEKESISAVMKRCWLPWMRIFDMDAQSM